MTTVLTREALTREALTREALTPEALTREVAPEVTTWQPARPAAWVEAARLRRRRLAAPAADIVEQRGMESFPASDPPSNW